MNHFTGANNHLLVLNRGEQLHQQLELFADKHQLKMAWLSGLGGADSLTLGYYNLKTKQYKWQSFNQELEILSLTGNLSIVDGHPFWHIHGSFSGPDYKVIGGHVKSLSIGLTGELFITPHGADITRAYDETTGLKLICPL